MDNDDLDLDLIAANLAEVFSKISIAAQAAMDSVVAFFNAMPQEILEYYGFPASESIKYHHRPRRNHPQRQHHR